MKCIYHLREFANCAFLSGFLRYLCEKGCVRASVCDCVHSNEWECWKRACLLNIITMLVFIVVDVFSLGMYFIYFVCIWVDWCSWCKHTSESHERGVTYWKLWCVIILSQGVCKIFIAFQVDFYGACAKESAWVTSYIWVREGIQKDDVCFNIIAIQVFVVVDVFLVRSVRYLCCVRISSCDIIDINTPVSLMSEELCNYYLRVFAKYLLHFKWIFEICVRKKMSQVCCKWQCACKWEKEFEEIMSAWLSLQS